jgi:small subunit ribosomal protein S17
MTTETTKQPKAEIHNGRELTGIVASVKMNKTIVIEVIQIRRHPLYRKTIRTTKRFFAHYEGNTLKVGDHVTVTEIRPMSKLKRFIVKE